MGMPVIRGRDFTALREDWTSVVIGAASAHRLWPGADPIGRRIVSRTALGADRRQVVGWFLRRGLRLSVAGMALGLTLSLIVVKLIVTLQGEAPPSGIIGLAAAVASIAVTVALVATWIPARRAATIDPILALRIE
jgi:ABC-type antimicrobial peptide transport system permease subunit